MRIIIRNIRNHTILELHEKVDCFNISELKSEIVKLINAQDQSVVLDLKNVEYMDSSGIGVIFLADKLVSRYKGNFSLINVRNDLLDLIKLTASSSMIRIYRDEQSLP